MVARVAYAGSNLESAYINTLMTALLVALSGRVWEGKVCVWFGPNGCGPDGDNCILVLRKLWSVHRE